jgi:hypothetical protein
MPDPSTIVRVVAATGTDRESGDERCQAATHEVPNPPTALADYGLFEADLVQQEAVRDSKAWATTRTMRCHVARTAWRSSSGH